MADTKKKDKEKKPKDSIDLLTSIPRTNQHPEKGQRIQVIAEALVFTTAEKKGIPGKTVEFFGTDPKDILRRKKTNKDGKAIVDLNFNPRFEGQKLIINARIKGTNIKKSVESYLIPDFGSGIKRFWNIIRYNWKRKMAKIATYLSLTTAINILAAWVLYFSHGGISAAIFIGALIGALTFKVTKNKLAGIVSAGGIICLAYFVPALFISSFRLTIWFIMTAGIFSYLLEELTCKVVIKSDGEKPVLHWQKLKNFYPYYPAMFAALMVVFNIIQLINALIFPETANIGGPGIIISAEQYFNPSGTAHYFIESGKHLMGIINWLVAGSILVLYAIPGEFLSLFTSFRGIHEGLGIGVFIKEVGGWLKKVFTFKGGK